MLACLEQQSIPSTAYRVIVVDDGSTDDTEAFLKEFQRKTPLQLSYITQLNQGQGNARNTGISAVETPLTLFLQSDMYPDPECLAWHLRVHEKYPEEQVGVLGYITWEKSLEVTPFMYFLEHGGHQFAYDKAAKAPCVDKELGLRQVSYHFFYTGNISLKTSLLKKEKFDPSYTSYGWEDIELGYRYQKKYGFRLLYTDQAKVGHYHPMTEEGWEERMRNVGRNLCVIQKRHPELTLKATGAKRLILQTIALPIVAIGAKAIGQITHWQWCISLYYYSRMKRMVFEGIREGCSSEKAFL